MENNNDKKNDDNTMITPDSSEAIDKLIELLITANPGDKVYLDNNFSMIEKYLEMLSGLGCSPEEIKKIRKRLRLPSRRLNQLNAEDFAGGANSLTAGGKYLIDEKGKER